MFTVFINHIDSDLKKSKFEKKIQKKSIFGKKYFFLKNNCFIGFFEWVYMIQSGPGLVASFEKRLHIFFKLSHLYWSKFRK